MQPLKTFCGKDHYRKTGGGGGAIQMSKCGVFLMIITEYLGCYTRHTDSMTSGTHRSVVFAICFHISFCIQVSNFMFIAYTHF